MLESSFPGGLAGAAFNLGLIYTGTAGNGIGIRLRLAPLVPEHWPCPQRKKKHMPAGFRGHFGPEFRLWVRRLVNPARV
jgi:hypothetical protein